MGALLGFGAAYAVRKKEGKMGKAARSLGKFTISMKEKAYDVEEEYHYLERSTKAIDSVTPSIAKSFTTSSWNAAKKFTEDNQLLERGVEETGKGIEYISSSISRYQESQNGTPNNYVRQATASTTTNNRDQQLVQIYNNDGSIQQHKHN